MGIHCRLYERWLMPLEASDRNQFILDNQEAFNFGALEEFGLRDDHFEEEGEIISWETIEQSIDGGEAYRIVLDDQPVGGVIIKVDGNRGDLEIMFVSPRVHSKGIGYAAWCAVDFYVNRCGFHIVEFFNSHHPDPNDPDTAEQMEEQFPDGMFRFEKVMRS